MFQHYDVQTDSSHAAPRIRRLREKLAEVGVDGFLVPRADEHQGEYVPLRAERLKWLTGFTGSAGAALVLADKAIIFVDGRYRLQVRVQTDPAVFDYEDFVETPPPAWLGKHGSEGLRIGFDPWLHTIGEVRRLTKACKRKGVELVPLDANPVDAVWDDQPQAPIGAVDVHPLDHAGEDAASKLARLAAAIAEDGADAAVLTDPASLAWAFNIRGHDLEHTPVPLGFALVRADGRHVVFVDGRKLDVAARDHLSGLARLAGPDELLPTIEAAARDGQVIGLDPDLAAERLRIAIVDAGGKTVDLADPARLPRATKNAAELAGARAAHRRDGAALVRFLRWLDGQQPGTVDEINAARQLEAFRVSTGEALQAPLRDISFDTIAGAGPNGAIIHYRVNTATNRRLAPGELFLVDSGGQYRDGTTDVTRTVAIGTPTGEMRQRYTIVLKGLMAVSTIRFPPGTRGQDIDPLARQAHWMAGIDYGHGTGHGVGSYLSVHEGPQRIAKTGTQKLLAGMILSNEPGYYRDGAYGIRLENLIVVTEPAQIEGGEIAMHGFETLTLAPFDRRLIDRDALRPDEVAWLDAYHARVLAEIGPLLDEAEREWLAEACAPLAPQPKK